MDPFSVEEELLTITTLFHTHAYPEVLSYDITPLSAPNRTYAQTLQARSRIALGQSQNVLSSVSSSNSPSSLALKALAQHTLGDEQGIATAKELAEQEPEDGIVQIVCGTVLASARLFDEAKTLLARHQGSLEAVALLTQIHLMQNRTDLALKEVQTAKRWAQDSLLINLAEAWVGLRVGGDSYQSSYYVYEELSSSSSSTPAATLLSQAIADMHLNRLPEAEAALSQALDLEPQNPFARANQVVLACLMGKKWPEVVDVLDGLKELDGERKQGPGQVGDDEAGLELLRDLENMESKFEEARAKFAPRVASTAA